MPSVSRISALFCGVAFGLLSFRRHGPPQHELRSLAPTSWTPPTPTEGATLGPRPGDLLRFNLAALAQDAPSATITIDAAGVPPGATFRTTPGNPAAAGFVWVPRPAQAGRKYSLTFTAQPDDQAVPPRTRRVDVRGRGEKGGQVRAQQRRNGDVPLGVRHPPGGRPERAEQERCAGRTAQAPDPREHDEPRAGHRGTANGERRLGAGAPPDPPEQLDRLGAEANARQLADGADAPPRRPCVA